ncbi:MAG TPA: HEAT repeat domain-containing protein [Ignavibacteriaceae bacterium]|nr:HEAT repeat domain-containing protein [Ignavibacteriaceae bacterium]
MKHQKYKEMMELALLQELNDAELEELHKHLIDCEDCQYEYDKLNDFYKSIDNINKKELNEISLQNARRELRLALDKETSSRSFFEKITDGVKNFTFYNYRPLITGASTMVIGLFMGYVFFHTGSQNDFIETAQIDQTATKITNVRFMQTAGINGEVEFTFEAIKPMTMKGKMSDPKIQMILAQALLNEKNAGSRFNTVSAIESQTVDNNKTVDPKIKSVLISTLKFDENPGVRNRALSALLNIPYDQQVKETLLYALVNDNNSGIRIAAINGLTSASMEGNKFDEETLKILKQKSLDDENEYIRIRAASLVKEAQL